MTDRVTRVHKAVIPAAGYGTRFLPATKAQPKEMIPVVDRPAIQYVVDEAVGAGIDDITMIVSSGKESLADHFDRMLELERVLVEKGKTELYDEIRRLGELAQFSYVRQPEQLGLGHAVLCAAPAVGEESFAVLLGDDFLDERDPFLHRMIDLHERTGRAVIALMEVPEDQVHLYGCAAATPTDEDGVFELTDLIEKPSREEAPSNLAVIGRYVLPGEIFDVLAKTEKGHGGEIQLTDALRTLAQREPIYGIRFDGRRYDVGDKQGYLQATVQLALARDDLGPAFKRWLVEYVAGLE